MGGFAGKAAHLRTRLGSKSRQLLFEGRGASFGLLAGCGLRGDASFGLLASRGLRSRLLRIERLQPFSGRRVEQLQFALLQPEGDAKLLAGNPAVHLLVNTDVLPIYQAVALQRRVEPVTQWVVEEVLRDLQLGI